MNLGTNRRVGIILEAQKAKEFAYWCFMLRDPNLAAKKMGLEDGILLLSERRVQTQLKRLRKLLGKESAGEIAKLGLSRILFSQIGVDGEGNPEFDGFSVEKYSAEKGVEYKFWDKLKACELLLKLAALDGSQERAEFGGVLAALQQSVAGEGKEGAEEDMK